MKAFTVNSKDLTDKNKNPGLSLSAKDILKNNKIKKRILQDDDSLTKKEIDIIIETLNDRKINILVCNLNPEIKHKHVNIIIKLIDKLKRLE